jgi:hypothetical protein
MPEERKIKGMSASEYNKKYQKEYYAKNREKKRESERIRSKEYYAEHLDVKQKWRDEHKDKIKEYNSNYNSNPDNKEKINEQRRIYKRKRRNIDPLFKLTENIHSLIKISLKQKGYKKNTKTINILGCTGIEFKEHIERQFLPWMNWDNYGRYNGEYEYGWDIDHIIELKTVNTEDDVIKLNHYTNLRPLDSKINRYDRNYEKEENKVVDNN